LEILLSFFILYLHVIDQRKQKAIKLGKVAFDVD